MAATLFATAAASAADLKLICSEILSSPTSSVPGALDAAGQPVATTWASLASPGLSVRINGDDWVVRGTTTQVVSLDNILIRGCGSTGSMFLQEGQPLQGGGAPGEAYSFFDSPPADFNASGQIAYSCRATGGVTTDDEKLATYQNGAHTIILQQGSPLLGLQNQSATIVCTNPVVGNSIGSVTRLDSGVVAWGNTPITGCSSFLYPALFNGNMAVMQNGITTLTSGQVGEEHIDGFAFDDAAFSPDGQHILINATTNNPDTTRDDILLLDTGAIMRRLSPIFGTSVIYDETFHTWYAPNGDWYVRGDDPSANDWAVRNGTMLAKTGDPITTSSAELFGNTISSFVGNADGDWIIVGNTNNPDLNVDTVLVLNGTQVIVREGDPIDVDGDGQFDDDAFIATFSPDSAFITNDDVLYFLGTLRNGALTTLGSMMIRADLGPACDADIDGSNSVDVNDLLAVITTWGPCVTCPAVACPADIAPECPDCVIDVNDLLAVISTWGRCP